MATATQVISRAMKVAGALPIGQTPSAEEFQDCLAVLNQMLAYWAQNGIDLNCPSLSVATVLPVPESALEPITYNLAARIANEFGNQLSPVTAKLALDGEMWLRNNTIVIPDSSSYLFHPDAIYGSEL